MNTPAQVREDGPVTRARLNDLTLRLLDENLAKFQGVVKPARSGEDRRVRADAYQGTQNLLRHSVSRIAIDRSIEPLSVLAVALSIIAECIDKDVDVRQYHRRPSILSRRAPESLRLTPGATPPPARETGSFTRLRRVRDWELANTSRKPCSIMEVSVSPRFWASRFTCRRKFSSSRTVVLICLDISTLRPSVKHARRRYDGGVQRRPFVRRIADNRPQTAELTCHVQ